MYVFTTDNLSFLDYIWRENCQSCQNGQFIISVQYFICETVYLLKILTIFRKMYKYKCSAFTLLYYKVSPFLSFFHFNASDENITLIVGSSGVNISCQWIIKAFKKLAGYWTFIAPSNSVAILSRVSQDF